MRQERPRTEGQSASSRQQTQSQSRLNETISKNKLKRKKKKTHTNKSIQILYKLDDTSADITQQTLVLRTQASNESLVVSLLSQIL